jgi:hypothetical protein
MQLLKGQVELIETNNKLIIFLATCLYKLENIPLVIFEEYFRLFTF